MRRTAKTMAMHHRASITRASITVTPTPHFPRPSLAVSLLACCASVVLLAACGTTTLKHGQHYTQAELLQVQPGMSQDEVRMALGSPATTSTVNSGAAYYYIASTRKQTAFLDPKEVDRKVVAVYFTPIGSVERVAQYGMKDGKVFDFITRQTPSATKTEDGVIQMLFRNLGKRGSVFGE